MTTARHPSRIIEATELGKIAGHAYQALADQQCTPEEWTSDRIEWWCTELAEVRENPYEVGPPLYPDATDEQNAKYAHTWTIAFDQARHAVQAEHGRAAA